jgi:hypothetical protein
MPNGLCGAMRIRRKPKTGIVNLSLSIKKSLF